MECFDCNKVSRGTIIIFCSFKRRFSAFGWSLPNENIRNQEEDSFCLVSPLFYLCMCMYMHVCGIQIFSQSFLY